jgi:mRNA interferase YafQ
MLRIERTNAFRRDFKREKRGRFGRELEQILTTVVQLLADNKVLLERYRDHALGGEWNDCRECHIKPDLLLIYRVHNDEALQLVRLGSHSELFG